ncbi:Uu.00g020410.m01.CDS01 [Anthostomella pinea]|uniref:Uu.00g020410.m01.CDS01 n=1 Tax=Anthostomella pinea TaxID=933095 RepID=A0AAI8YNN4_9PEZI|nr:Uu.00g020410.m01.CDS01 [Anthostomella pinea]
MTPEVDALPADQGYGRPKTRQRIQKPAPSLAVPNIDEDAAERRRVLNVLAQRRYRERKRHAKGRTVARDTASTSSSTPQSNGSVEGTADQSCLSAEVHQVATPPLQEPGDASHEQSRGSEGVDVCLETLWPTEASEPTTQELLSNEEYLHGFDGSDLSNEHDAIFMPSDACSSFSFPSTVDPAALFAYSPARPPVIKDVDDLSFPDSYLLPVNELTLLKAFLRIGSRIKCNSSLWEMTATSPFNDGTHTPASTLQLPATWRPTPSQISVPHHPVIDMLPWPSVRERIIMLLCLPDEARPPAAAGPLALVQLAYDLEDAAEGVRIWGNDPCEATAWEVGQVLFERWWFVFDRKIVDQSNYWRRLRGAESLSMKAQ